MKYCNKCKRLYNDEDLTCESCKGKSKLVEIKDENTPVYLLSAEGFELKRITAALDDAQIPCEEVYREHNYSGNAATGFDTSRYDVLVPYSAYEKAYDTCVGIGAIRIGEEEIVEDDSNAENTDAEPVEQMSKAKRTTVKVVTAVLFLALVALAVYGTDFIMNIIKGLF